MVAVAYRWMDRLMDVSKKKRRRTACLIVNGVKHLNTQLFCREDTKDTTNAYSRVCKEKSRLWAWYGNVETLFRPKLLENSMAHCNL